MMMSSLSLPSTLNFLPPSLNHSTNPSRQKLSSSTSRSLKTPNFETLKNRLIQLANTGQLPQAISTLELMSQNKQTTPDLTSYSILLKSCIRTRNFALGKLIHSKLVNSGIELDVIALNSIISLYSKGGDWVTAKSVFESMGVKKDLVSWSAMISCFANNGMEVEAIATFFDMVCIGEYPNEYCFGAVIRACCDRSSFWIGMVIFGFVIKTGYFESDLNVGCMLIDMFAKGGGDLVSAKMVFDKMPERNTVTWTLMLTRYAQLSHPGNAVELFVDMIESEFIPDRFTFSSVISACAELGCLSLGQQVHSWVIKSRLSSDVCVGCSLVDMYAKCAGAGSVDDSSKVFDRIPDHNVMSWTAIITGYVQNGNLDREAIQLYCRMMIEGQVLPNQFTFSSILKACANLSSLELGEQVHNHAVKLGLASVNCVGNSLISMYAQSGSMEDARKAFDILFEKNLISYNTIVDCYAQNLNSDEAFGLFNQIDDSGIVVDAFTFASLLSGAASVGAVGKGEGIHARLLKAGFESNQCICNSLVSMYSKCGNIEAAFQVFDTMEQRNVISWTSMIMGFAKHGFAERALEMFDQMIEAGIKPNEVTYIAVLLACSHVGMISEGWKHYNSMHKEHGISPRMEHYACMVDLLGRSGFLEDAIRFINSMPFAADALVWRTLLGACRVHGNTELGKYAAEMILELDPSDPAAYVLLSNLYASTSQWENVVEIRKMMKERNLVKEAGCSWIEAENRVHKFHVGDTSHPKSPKIYEELDQLVYKIKEMGYVPNMDFVLHDVDLEQKEKYLLQHSEKIAVTFGLISTAKPKPIRIFKNLRVCGDCHTAMKYISMATGREIVVRDSNRFHHIKDGTCSCKDYW
ncbi:hypothetical protein LguiA_031818 [Lonicera macranthoides]